MDKINKIDHSMEIDSDSNTAVEGEKSLLDVLHTESDIIAEIFSYLKLKDRLNLGVSCKEMEKVHSSRPQFWQKVWLDLSKSMETSPSSNLSRKYINIKYELHDDKSEHSPYEMLAPFAETLNALNIDHHHDGLMRSMLSTRQHVSLHSQKLVVKLIAMFPLFDNLMHIDIYLSGDVLKNLSHFLDIESANATIVIKKKLIKLQNLRTNIELLAIMHKCIDFSSITKLKSLTIIPTEYYNGGITEKQLRSARSTLRSLIVRQNGLYSLRLGFEGCSFIFNRPLVLKCQLKNFQLFEHSERKVNFTRQENLLDFLQSQKTTLKSPMFRLNGPSSPRMFQYRAKVFDLPLESQYLIVIDDFKVRMAANIEKNFFSVSEIRQLRIEPNLVTTSVHVSVNEIPRQNGWLDFIRSKFPNMENLNADGYFDIGYDLYDGDEDANLPNLQSLQTLSHLKCLKIRTDDICNALCNVKLPNLTKFEFEYIERHKYGFINLESVRELKKFINRHKMLTDLSFKLPNNCSSENPDEIYAKEANGLLHFVIKNSKELMSMEFNSVEFPCDPTNLEMTRNVIEAHAIIGFTLKVDSVYLSDDDDDDYSCYEVTMIKTADGVEETRKKWW